MFFSTIEYKHNLPCKGRGTAQAVEGFMYNHNKSLTPYAKALRKNMTPEERCLWYNFLRQYKIRFLRQKVIKNYIVDFYCSKASLIIEIDGGQHYEDNAILNDRLRDEELSKLGYKVLRFTNLDIKNNFEGVCFVIDKNVQERIPL